MQNSAANPVRIGVFDSGVGGLSVLQALRSRLPGMPFIYVADSGHAPYGDRSAEFVEARAREVARFLARRQVRALVIACNTASVVAAARLRNSYSLPIVAMEPAIKPAALATRSKVVLVLATTGTIRSESVARLCRTYGNGSRIILQPCPGLADQVERGAFQDEATRQLLEKYVLPGVAEGADTIVLGCTHYTFLAKQISLIAGPSVGIVESSEAIARQLSRLLPIPLPESKHGAAGTEFYTSGCTRLMTSFLASIGEPVDRVFALPPGEVTGPA